MIISLHVRRRIINVNNRILKYMFLFGKRAQKNLKVITLVISVVMVLGMVVMSFPALW